MRYLYANADKYSMNTDHIRASVFQGEYAITRLSDPIMKPEGRGAKIQGLS
jgi:hypothetical protein